MNLRISKNQLRFRLSPEDVTEFLASRTLREHVALTHESQWEYDLKIRPEPEPRIEVKGSHLEIVLPEAPLVEWLTGSDIEWAFAQSEPAIEITIEKDLKPGRH